MANEPPQIFLPSLDGNSALSLAGDVGSMRQKMRHGGPFSTLNHRVQKLTLVGFSARVRNFAQGSAEFSVQHYTDEKNSAALACDHGRQIIPGGRLIEAHAFASSCRATPEDRAAWGDSTQICARLQPTARGPASYRWFHLIYR